MSQRREYCLMGLSPAGARREERRQNTLYQRILLPNHDGITVNYGRRAIKRFGFKMSYCTLAVVKHKDRNKTLVLRLSFSC